MLESPPLVSVIVPVFNAAKFIEQGYAQIKAQDYPNLEILFIDNNSSDETVHLIQALQTKDQRIRLLYESKQGAGAARNFGIYASKGSVLSFFDIDDEIVPFKISRQVHILECNPEVVMVFGKLNKYYPDKRYGYLIPESKIPPGKCLPYKLGMMWTSHFGNIVNPSVVTCRKTAALAVNGFEEELLRGEDAAFLIKMAFHFPVYFDDIVTGTYIRHSESTVSTDNKQSKGNPYYFQYKTFYLPYLRKFSEHHQDKKPKRLIYRIILGSLNNHVHILSPNILGRWHLLKKELKELTEKGFPPRMVPHSIFLGVVPESFSKILLKAYLKLINLFWVLD